MDETVCAADFLINRGFLINFSAKKNIYCDSCTYNLIYVIMSTEI